MPTARETEPQKTAGINVMDYGPCRELGHSFDARIVDCQYISAEFRRF